MPGLKVVCKVTSRCPVSIRRAARPVSLATYRADPITQMTLEREDFANSIRQGTRPRAHGEVGLEVERVLAAAQEVYERQERQNVAIMV